jgi:O-antigen/teichoic acid export membrane protein
MIKKIQQIGSNKGVAALSCKLASAFFSFIFVLVVARLLSTDDAGVFLYSYTLMMILVQLSRAGTEHSLVKALSGQVTKIDTDVVIKKISIYVGLIALALMIIIISFAYSGIMEIYTDKDNLYTLYYFCATVLLFALCQILGSYFQTRLEVYSQYWAMNVGIVLLGSILVLTLLLFDKKISSLILSQSFFVINIVL